MSSIFNRLLVRSLPFVPKPIVWRIAKRYIAGLDLDSAARLIAGLKARGLRATVDILGENISTPDEAREARNAYAGVLDRIGGDDLPAGISVKLTQMGLKLDPALARSNLESLAEMAGRLRRFVRIDMEDSSTTSATLDLYTGLRGKHENLGIVLQAYLRRTQADVEALADLRPDVRLCKGIYVEPPEVAFQGYEEVRQNFLLILRLLLEKGSRVAIATHDPYLVDESLRIAGRLDPRGERHEFQMLHGVGENLWGRILSSGRKLRIYVPFGQKWYEYSLRRLRENPQIAGYVAKALLRIR